MTRTQGRLRWDEGRKVLAAGLARRVGDRYLIVEVNKAPSRGATGELELVDSDGGVVCRARVSVLFFERHVGVGLKIDDEIRVEDDRPLIPLPEASLPRTPTLDDFGERPTGPVPTPPPAGNADTVEKPRSDAHRRPSAAPRSPGDFLDPFLSNARSSAATATSAEDDEASNPPLPEAMPPASEPPEHSAWPRWKPRPSSPPGWSSTASEPPRSESLPPPREDARRSAAPAARISARPAEPPPPPDDALPASPPPSIDDDALPGLDDAELLFGDPVEGASLPPDDDNRRSDEDLSRWRKATRSSESPRADVAEDEVEAADTSPSQEGFGAEVQVATRRSASPTGHVIGIDLGTSNTCASVVVDGQPKVIPTRWGTSTIPSVLANVDGRLVVGHAAAKRMILEPSEAIYGSKRLVGRVFSRELHEEFQPYFAYALIETEAHGFGAPVGGRIVTFEEVAMRLLSEVRMVAEEHLGAAVTHAVITVPAYFAETQRQAVREAARRAGLVVGRLVNEPTAAAVAYGYLRPQNAMLLVFDLGGGTFDVSIVEVEGDRFEVLGTGGDAFLGGIDVDDLLAARVFERFLEENHLSLEPTPQMIARLREAAEEAKRELSVQQSFHVHLRHYASADGRPLDLDVTVTQEELHELARPFTERLLQITADVLREQNLAPARIDEVLLVGGSTRLPFVEEAVSAFFHTRPSKRINPDEAVALGAALLAERGGLVELVDVLPLSIGIAGPGRTMLRLIARNTTIPVDRRFTAHTEEQDQARLAIPLFQGERTDATENEYLGTLVVEDLPSGPPGREIDLLLRLDANGALGARARDTLSRRPLRSRIDSRRSVADVRDELGEFDGPEQPRETRQGSALGRFFRAFLKRVSG